MNNKTLRNYARLIVRVGANVQKGQMVVVRASVSDEYFVKLVVEEAYKAKASMVRVDWNSDEITKLVYKYTKLDKLKAVETWKVEKLKYDVKNLPAMIYIDSEDPDALSEIDQDKMMEVQKAQGPIIRPIRKQMENKYQWTIVAIPSEAWARKLFPDVPKAKAVANLWDAILKCARADSEDPVDAWNKHNAELSRRCAMLNVLGIKKLIYKNSLGTDFEVGLLDGLQFCGGGENTISGVFFNPNMPTEECFTSPDKSTAKGVVYATKPLSLNGTVIKDFGFRFEKGNVVEVLAKDEKTKEMLEQLISIDEGAKRLGEAALVPFDSPINESGILFLNTLFDENACCHLALGMGFEDTIKGFDKMTREQIDAFGINDSAIHVDFMIGSSDLSIKAVLKDDSVVDIFKDGTWAK